MLQDFEKNVISENTLLINTSIKTLNEESDTIFNLTINTPKILKIMSDANNSTKRDIERKKLYSLLLPTYKVLKKHSINKLFFQLPNSIAFLRFQKKNIYGDSIKNIRTSIDLVNETKKYIKGFEQGIMVGNFRNVYPLNYKNKFVGTVEISYSIKAISKILSKKDYRYYGLLEKKDLIQKKVWKIFNDNYISSSLSNKYMWDKKNFKQNFNKIKIQNIEQELSKNKPFVKETSLNGSNFLIIFQPLKNITSQQIGYIVTIEKNNFLTKHTNKYKQVLLIVFIASILISILLFLFLKNEAKQKNNLKRRANYDPLTNLLNRRGFEIAYETLNPTSFVILFLDIDHFKKVNDTYGHDTGDEVIKKLSEVLQNNVRKTDLIARWGGEEFVVLLNNINLKTAKEIAEDLRINVENYNDSKIPHFTISIGIASVTEYENELDMIITKADSALYEAKNNGRNRVLIFKD